MNLNNQEIQRQIRNRDVLLVGLEPLESALSDKMALTIGLGVNVQTYYVQMLRAVIDLTAALDRLSMEDSTVRARAYAEQRHES